jgi:hypothetical protein
MIRSINVRAMCRDKLGGAHPREQKLQREIFIRALNSS